MSLFEHKTRLVIIGADAMDLCDYKAKYRHFGYNVTTVLVTDSAKRGTFCGKDAHGAVSRRLLKEYEEMYPHVPGIQHLDYMADSARALLQLLEHIRPESLLTDYHMTGCEALFPEGGLSLIQAVRSEMALQAMPVVMHTPEFDLEGKDPEFVDIAPLYFWLTRTHDADAHRCFQHELLEIRRAEARRKHDADA